MSKCRSQRQHRHYRLQSCSKNPSHSLWLGKIKKKKKRDKVSRKSDSTAQTNGATRLPRESSEQLSEEMNSSDTQAKEDAETCTHACCIRVKCYYQESYTTKNKWISHNASFTHTQTCGCQKRGALRMRRLMVHCHGVFWHECVMASLISSLSLICTVFI